MCIGERYELVRRIGSGAMGEVWAAHHRSLLEPVAIKLVLRNVLHGDGSSADSRFHLEARVAAQLSRKTRHIVSVTDHGADGPYAYLVMELLNGESLEDRLARTGPMPLTKVVPIVYQIARALAVAHADGVIHRDLKPSNVFVTVDEDGKALVKILDFGIAKLRASMRGSTAKHATMRGVLLGTPAYMSPEHARGKVIDHRADVWALAVITYHLLTRELPFDGESPEELFYRLCTEDPVPIARYRPDLPAVVGELFERAFTRRLDQRFQSASAFAGALEHTETALRRAATPKAMVAISLPPPAVEREATPTPPPPAEKVASSIPPPLLAEAGSSIVAAGVPRRRALWPRLLGAALVVAVLSLTGSALWVYFDRDTRPAPVAARALVIPPVAARDEVPPPPDPAPLVRAADLPTTPPSASPVMASPVVPKGSEPLLAPSPPSSAATPEPPPAVSPPAKVVDRSEVF
jgi:serine/threonine protein kinase